MINGILVLLGVVLLKEIAAAVSNWLTWRTRIRIHHNLLRITVGRLHILPVEFHRLQGTGAIMTKLERGIQDYFFLLILIRSIICNECGTGSFCAGGFAKAYEGINHSLIIAHRLKTVVNANQIVVLNQGMMIEKGTHKELMENNGYYASLVKKQTHGLLKV